MAGASQRHLVKQACEGNRDAFAKLMASYELAMRITATRLLGDMHDAEDAVQEALTKAFAGLSQLREPGKFGPWLTAIVVNECRQLRRRNCPMSLPVPCQVVGPEVCQRPARELGAVLAETASRILELPPRESVAAAWFYFHGASYADIAGFLGTTVAAVQSALQRAREKLRNQETDIRKKGELLMENSEACLRRAAETPQLVVEDLDLGEHRWGENRFSCCVKNTSGERVLLGLDIRTCVAKAGDWQTQWFYELKPGEERHLSETYHIFRVLCPWYAVFRGPGMARVRVTLTQLSEEEFQEQSGEFICRSPGDFLFQRWFQVMVPADSQSQGIPVAPVLPKAGDVTVENVELGSISLGKHLLRVTCRNHTDEARQLHLHVNAPAFGAGKRLCLEPNADTEAWLEYWVHRENAADGGDRTLLLLVVQLPLNVNDLDLQDAGPVFLSQYMAEVPEALVAKTSFALK